MFHTFELECSKSSYSVILRRYFGTNKIIKDVLRISNFNAEKKAGQYSKVVEILKIL